MIFKGGNALRFAYQSPRSTKDLDFTADMKQIPDNETRIRQLLDSSLQFAVRRFNVKAKCQHVKRNPKSSEATRPTYDINVGYQFPGDRYFHNFEEKTVSSGIPIEISLNDLVCDTQPWTDIEELIVCSLEDIIAEKLRSLLQQKIRNRNRWQDVYDVCTYVRRADFDRAKVADFLKQKSIIREIDATKSSFDDEIRHRASADYEKRVRTEAPDNFIPFDEAWNAVISLVKTLDLPD
tara:strand:+ start:12079 stop:12789 length:711 start_codon:yes stop_codon:yes gene_type:complete